MALTDMSIRNLKPGDRLRKVSDVDGLYLAVTTKGSKVFRYDFSFQGKRQTRTLGQWPGLKLAEARAMKARESELLDRGIDPREGKILSLGGDSFKAVAGRWLKLQSGSWDARYASIVRNLIERDLYPDLADRPVSDIEPPELLEVLRKIERRGVRETAHRACNYAGKVFRFAIAEGVAQRDPSRDIRDALAPKAKVRHMAKFSADDLADYFSRLRAANVEEVTREALDLAMLTACRTSEIRFAIRSEFEDIDSDTPRWRISAERMKMDREHIVPLSRQAAEIVRRRISMVGGEYLFPADTATNVISENRMLYALYRMGYHQRATVHGFRRTFSTIANEHEWNADWIELCLAHVQGGVRGAYNSARYLNQRRELLQWWADYLDGHRSKSVP